MNCFNSLLLARQLLVASRRQGNSTSRHRVMYPGSCVYVKRGVTFEWDGKCGNHDLHTLDATIHVLRRNIEFIE